VTESAKAGRPNSRTPQLSLWIAAGGRSRLLGAGAIVLLVGAILGYINGLRTAFRDVGEARVVNQQLQAENQGLKGQISDENGELSRQHAQLIRIQDALDAITPSENTYNFNPNQSLIVAQGRLTVGLIGLPSNEVINVNINGKPHSAAAGDVITVALDASTNCQVAVQSFDMFKATLTVSCAATNAK
jgi:hypothetical protein